MTVTYDFSGKVALVTGAASGLGRRAAKAGGGACDQRHLPREIISHSH